MTRYGLPSPFAQNRISFFDDRFAGMNCCAPGENMAPAHACANASEIVPAMRMAFALPCAPPSTTSIVAVDLPPAIASVVTAHPAPYDDVALPDSKSLTIGDDAPAGPRAIASR